MYSIPQQLQQLFDPWPDETCMRSFMLLEELPDLSPEIFLQLAQIPSWNCEEVTHAHIFVDGSSFDQNRDGDMPIMAAWSFIVVFDIDTMEHMPVPSPEPLLRFMTMQESVRSWMML